MVGSGRVGDLNAKQENALREVSNVISKINTQLLLIQIHYAG